MSHGVIANLPNIENLGSTTKCCGLEVPVMIELKSDLSIKCLGASYIYIKQKNVDIFFINIGIPAALRVVPYGSRQVLY